MVCQQCLDDPYKDKLCVKCYARRVKNRITKALRGTLTQADKVILVLDDGSAPAAVLVAVLRGQLAKTDREVQTIDHMPESAHKIFVPDTVDVVLNKMIESIAKTGLPPPKNSAVVVPLAKISVEDCEVLAHQWGLNFVKKLALGIPGLDELEKKYPRSKATLSKALHLS